MTTYETQQLGGLARWQAECAGEISPPPELCDLRRRCGWKPQQISLAFEALAGIPVHAVNGSYLIFDRELTSKEASALMRQRLIRLDRDGWALTRKGEEMLALLAAYSDPRQPWSGPPIRF